MPPRLLGPSAAALVLFSSLSWSQTVPIEPPAGDAFVGPASSLPGGVASALEAYFPDLHKDIGPSLDQLKGSLAAETDAAKQASLRLIYDALKRDPQTLPASLRAAGLTPALARRIEEVAAHVRKNPSLAARLAGEAPKLPAEDTRVEAKTPSAPDFEPSRPAPALPPIEVKAADARLSWGGLDLPALAFPNEGYDPQADLVKAVDLADEVYQSNYNFDLPRLTDALTRAIEAGKKVVIVTDWSNMFQLQAQAAAGRKADEPQRTPQLQQLVDLYESGKYKNFRLYVATGLGSIGINHNKYTILVKQGQPVLVQKGSANYTTTSFVAGPSLSHFENVGYTAEPARTQLQRRYFDWQVRHAQPFSEGLEKKACEPVVTQDDPIPTDPSPSLFYAGRKYPVGSFSPNGGTIEWLTHMIADAKAWFVQMFSPFFPDDAAQAMIAQAKAGRPGVIIADRQQGHNAAAKLLPVVEAGNRLFFSEGPGGAGGPHSKMHEKDVLSVQSAVDLEDAAALQQIVDDIAAGKLPALVVTKNSTNFSVNAMAHNQENASYYLGGYHPAKHLVHFRDVMAQAQPVSADDLRKLAASHEPHHDTTPWTGEAPAKK